MHLIIDLAGAALQVRNDCFAIRKPDVPLQIIHPMRVSSVTLVQYCSITTAAAGLAAAYGIPVSLMHAQYPSCTLMVSALPHTGLLRIRQALFAFFPEANTTVKNWLQQKLAGQYANIEWLCRIRKIKKPDFELVAEANETMLQKFSQGIERQDFSEMEAYWAGIYWQVVKRALNDKAVFAGREQKDCKDKLNPCLNYAYAILLNKVEMGLLKLGLDPTIGILHAEGSHKMPLVYDIMEIWRPTIDQWLLEWMITLPAETHWQPNSKGVVRLTKDGRKALANLFYKHALPGKGRGKKGLMAEIDLVCKQFKDLLLAKPYEDFIEIKKL